MVQADALKEEWLPTEGVEMGPSCLAKKLCGIILQALLALVQRRSSDLVQWNLLLIVLRLMKTLLGDVKLLETMSAVGAMSIAGDIVGRKHKGVSPQKKSQG